MNFRLGRAQHGAISMRFIATRFHEVIVLAGAETAIRRCIVKGRLRLHRVHIMFYGPITHESLPTLEMITRRGAGTR